MDISPQGPCHIDESNCSYQEVRPRKHTVTAQTTKQPVVIDEVQAELQRSYPISPSKLDKTTKVIHTLANATSEIQETAIVLQYATIVRRTGKN